MSIKPIIISIDAAQLASQIKEFAQEVEQDLKKGFANLAPMTHGKVLELASTDLHSSNHILANNTKLYEAAPGIHVVAIQSPALWIEEGIKPNKDMKEDLLKNGKTSSKGYKYKTIPFEHSKPTSQLHPYAQNLLSRIKMKLREKGLPYKELERHPDGSPKVSDKPLHRFDFGGELPSRVANTPVLKGVTIYQTLTKTGNVRRDIFTFRTVSEGPGSEGKWIHPGFTGKKFLDKAADWAWDKWNNEILPDILEKWKK